ncbi:MAG: ABC transporter substrate-binding protein [Pannonibacter sp.]
MRNMLRVSVSFFLVSAACLTANAAEIKILAGDLPPMMNSDGTGREAEIIKTTLERCGHAVKFEVQPFTRHWASFKDGAGDAVTTVPPGLPLPGTPTSQYIAYQNGVAFLASRPQPFETLADLNGNSVVAFKGAAEIIPGFGDASKGFSEYREMADQITQNKLVFGGRAAAAVGDGMIFAEYSRQLQESKEALPFDPNQPVRFNALFEPSPYVMQFRDPAHAADFDRCFKEAEADGTIAKINKAWVDKYRDTLGSSYLNY